MCNRACTIAGLSQRFPPNVKVPQKPRRTPIVPFHAITTFAISCPCFSQTYQRTERKEEGERTDHRDRHNAQLPVEPGANHGRTQLPSRESQSILRGEN